MRGRQAECQIRDTKEADRSASASSRRKKVMQYARSTGKRDNGGVVRSHVGLRKDLLPQEAVRWVSLGLAREMGRTAD